jgi:cyclophilin family peptidyl-prolyl cis-trans isomerase
MCSAMAAGQETKPATRPEKPKPPATQPAPKLTYVSMTTSMGDILLELNREKAPITVDNFLSYVDEEFYDGTVFHRVIPDFMIQGGGFDPTLKRKQTKLPITNEWDNGLTNTRGTIAMARLPTPSSATSQFFINVRDNLRLSQPISGGAGYAVFGRVAVGMDVVDAIRVVPTTEVNRMQNVPIDTVVIKEVRRIDRDEVQKRIEARRGATTKPGRDR